MRNYSVEVTVTATVTLEAESDAEAERIVAGVLDNASHIIIAENVTEKEITEVCIGDDQLISDKIAITYGSIDRAE